MVDDGVALHTVVLREWNVPYIETFAEYENIERAHEHIFLHTHVRVSICISPTHTSAVVKVGREARIVAVFEFCSTASCPVALTLCERTSNAWNSGGPSVTSCKLSVGSHGQLFARDHSYG